MGGIHDGHRDRLRSAFRKSGLESFHKHQILELLLFYSIKRKDTNVTAHNLMERFGSISSVFDAPYESLREVDGVGDNSATLIKLVAALVKEYMSDCSSKSNKITTPDDAINYMRYKFLSEQRECIYMACMGRNGRVLFCDRLAEGTPDTVGIVPADAVKMVLRVNAVSAVIAHNHPNGICNPSSQDLRATSILYEEMKRVDIELLDHIIIAQDGEYSMKKNHMFPSCGR